MTVHRIWTLALAALLMAVPLAGQATGPQTGPQMGAQTGPHIGPQEVQDLRTRLAALNDRLETTPGARSTPLPVLWSQLKLDVPRRAATAEIAQPQNAAVPDSPAQAQRMNLRLGLTILSQTYTGLDNLDVELAQPFGRSDALSFRGGTVTLAGIKAAMAQHFPDDTGPALQVPVLLWDDTVLRLGPGDDLRLSRPHGAFVLSMGQVDVQGSLISGTGGDNLTSPDFRPFIVVGGGGSLEMRNAIVRRLGFGKTEKFSGISVAANPLMPRLGPVVIENTQFDEVATLTVAGAPGAVIRGNSFRGALNSALWLQAAPHSVIEGNLFYGTARTNAIRILRGSTHARAVGNILLEGARAGIVVDSRSDFARLEHNLIWRRDGGAIKLSRTRCGVLRGNIILDSRQKGIELRASRDTVMTDNLIWSSRNSGIWISDQPRGARTVLTDNRFMGNKAGLTMANGAEVQMAGNDLSRQMPRVISGDIGPHSVALVRDIKGVTPLSLSAAGGVPLDRIDRPDCDGEAF